MSSQPGPRAGEGRLVVGLVRGVHGLRGAVRVEILTDNEDRFTVGSTVFREGSDAPLTVTSAQRDGPGLLVRFREVTDRPGADGLRDAYLEADPLALEPESYYWHDIVGCSVVSQTGEDLGTVDDVFRVGEGEVYVAKGPRGELLIPAVSAVVLELTPADKRIVVDAAALGLTE